ncbi:unnamed protein product [Bemisia tabaci]|uniref:C2H2-type domain-containing protein n=1 Tax=Bemisia tabaci TaxID=7038 RepID=A0A9P0F6S4_BEMTA|nr:unnamed protein product [Bemisia tabaci]
METIDPNQNGIIVVENSTGEELNVLTMSELQPVARTVVIETTNVAEETPNHRIIKLERTDKECQTDPDLYLNMMAKKMDIAMRNPSLEQGGPMNGKNNETYNYALWNAAQQHYNQQLNKRFACTLCDKTFTQQGNLKTHMMSHYCERNFSCPYCEKTFVQKGNLKTHIMLHTKEKVHACQFCDKVFVQKGNLQSHILTHTKEKKFHCLICTKSFTQKGNLKTHFQIHTGVKRFQCPYCEKAFSQKGNLKTHVARHTGEKKFQCPICDKMFVQKNNLDKHMMNHSIHKNIDEQFNRSWQQPPLPHQPPQHPQPLIVVSQPNPMEIPKSEPTSVDTFYSYVGKLYNPNPQIHMGN